MHTKSQWLAIASATLLISAAKAEGVAQELSQQVSGFREQKQITCYEKIGGIIRSQARYTLQPSGDLVNDHGYTLSRFDRYRYPDDASGDTYMHKWIRTGVLRRYKYVGASNRVRWSEDFDFGKQEVRDAGRGTITCFTRANPMGMPIEYAQ